MWCESVGCLVVTCVDTSWASATRSTRFGKLLLHNRLLWMDFVVQELSGQLTAIVYLYLSDHKHIYLLYEIMIIFVVLIINGLLWTNLFGEKFHQMTNANSWHRDNLIFKYFRSVECKPWPLNLWTANWNIGYSGHSERSDQFGCFYAFSFLSQKPARETDALIRHVMRPVSTVATASSSSSTSLCVKSTVQYYWRKWWPMHYNANISTKNKKVTTQKLCRIKWWASN